MSIIHGPGNYGKDPGNCHDAGLDLTRKIAILFNFTTLD